MNWRRSAEWARARRGQALPPWVALLLWLRGAAAATGARLQIAIARACWRLGPGVGDTWTRGQAGQSMVEYAIVAALIAVVAMTAVEALGSGVSSVFQSIVGKVSGLDSG